MASSTQRDNKEQSWDTVFFRVEDRVFSRPRQEFLRHSAVFKDMYDVGDPSNGEGVAHDTPIVLEGYKSADFDALLRILYPRMEDVNTGGFKLTKSQWIGILRLSRAWEMQKIAELSVEMLSTLPLTPIEKVQLARDHKVASWLIEGLTSLVFGPPELSPTDLETSVGLQTAFRIVSLRAKTFSHRNLSPITVKTSSRRGKSSQVNNTTLTGVRLTALHCVGCSNQLITRERKCSRCAKTMTGADPHPLFVGADAGYVHLESADAGAYLSIDIDLVRCSACSGHIIGPHGGFNCGSCAKVVGFGDPVRICLTSKPSHAQTEHMVRKVFKDEISDYDL